jgi:hypothetical protein
VNLRAAHAHGVVEERLGFQGEVVGGNIGAPHAANAVQLRQLDLRRDGTDHVAGDLFLQVEDVFEIPVISFRPDVVSGLAVDELRGDPYPLAGSADAAFEDIADAKLLGDPP